MGTKVPKPPPDYGYGDDCLACHPAGKTPNYVFVVFHSIASCPAWEAPPNGHIFTLPQLPLDTCSYHVDEIIGGVKWRVFFSFASPPFPPGHSYLYLQEKEPFVGSYFFEHKAICSVDFENNINTCPPHGGEGGHGHVTTSVNHLIVLLTSEYHFMTQPGVLYEEQLVGMDHILVRLATKFDKSCCYFYVDEEDLPDW